MKYCTNCKHYWERKGVCVKFEKGVVTDMLDGKIIRGNHNGFPARLARIYLCKGDTFEADEYETIKNLT